jgi:hypothetical protein
LTVRYATLEQQFQSLLDLLRAANNQPIGPFLIDELNLTVLPRKIKHVGCYRLQEMSGDVRHAIGRVRRS